MISIDNYLHYLFVALFGGKNMVTLGIAQLPELGGREGNLLQLECVHFILFLILQFDQLMTKVVTYPSVECL